MDAFDRCTRTRVFCSILHMTQLSKNTELKVKISFTFKKTHLFHSTARI